ncbi:hypothetical protein V5P93_003107 [Actinokineospora auranticolor]|nr:hypothetical protein [Actinokineospora auranticolor]
MGVAFLLLAVAGCATAAPTPKSPPPATGFLASVRVNGGLCQGEPCGELLAVDAGGRWRRIRTTSEMWTGTLPEPRLLDLRSAVAASRLPEGGTGVCAAADGPTLTHAVAVDRVLRSASSCGGSVNAADSAVRALDDLLLDLGG